MRDGVLAFAPADEDTARLRAWLEYVAQTAIDLLDDLDRAATDLEDDEIEAPDWSPRS